MKFSRLNGLLYNISSCLGCRNLLGSSFGYSTKPMNAHKIRETRDNLYTRLSTVGNSKVSIVPILDLWIEEGRFVSKGQLIGYIKELRHYKRHSHALEISMWMTDKRYYSLTEVDVTIRLELISIIHGIEEAEKYFNNILPELKGISVYGSLLSCYAAAKSVEKAEAVMQKMRDLNFPKRLWTYNCMLNLYNRTGNYEKFDVIVREMEENGITSDKYTIGLQLTAYGAVSNIEGIETIITMIESSSNIVWDWTTYSIAAHVSAKVGLVDKALEMLKKCEGLVTSKRRRYAYNFLIPKYAALGKKDEILRIWETYKSKEKFHNGVYLHVISAVLSFKDFETAEKIIEEWEHQVVKYTRFPNVLIRAYSNRGFMTKAEALISRIVSKGGTPDALTFYNLATGYLLNDQTPKAVEMMKKAIMIWELERKPSSKCLASCLEYLKGEGGFEKVEEFTKLLVDQGIISVEIEERLLNQMRANSNILSTLKDAFSVQDVDAVEFLEADGTMVEGESETSFNNSIGRS